METLTDHRRGTRVSPEIDQELAATIPGGWGFRIRGAEIIAVVLSLAVAGAVFYMGHLSRLEHQAMVEEMQLQSHLLSLPPEKRPLIMPPAALWKRTQ